MRSRTTRAGDAGEQQAPRGGAAVWTASEITELPPHLPWQLLFIRIWDVQLEVIDRNSS